jgi:Cft2 family RNA processing exonuclease
MAAEVPYQYRPDILLVESTYGVQNHPPQEERERR